MSINHSHDLKKTFQLMRGAFYVATAFLIASSIRTAAESFPIKSDIKQYHDKSPVGASDTKTLPRRSLKGSGDLLETPVAEEERVIPTGVLEGAGIDVPEAILRLEKSGDGLNEMVKVGKRVGSSATSREKRIQILQKNHKDAVAKHQQVFNNYKNAIKKSKALNFERDTALIKYNYAKLLNDYHSAQAAKDAESHRDHRTFFNQLDSVVTTAAANVNNAKNERDKYLALLEETSSRAIAAYLAGNMDEYTKIEGIEAELWNEVDKAHQDIKEAEASFNSNAWAHSVAQKFLELTTHSYWKNFFAAEMYKNTVNEAWETYKRLDFEAKQAAQAVLTAKTKLGAQAEKIAFVFPEFEAAQAGKISKFDLNVKATLAEKPTHATQGQAASPAHFAIDSHDIPATEELELTLSLPNPTNQGTKLKRKRKQDQLDDNREGGSRIVNDLHPAIAQPARNTFPDVNYDPSVSKGKQTL